MSFASCCAAELGTGDFMLSGSCKAFTTYFALLAGSIGSLGVLSSILARQALAELIAPQAKPHISRVERGLIRQARAASHRAQRHRIEVLADEAPEISAADLAKAIDAAEEVEVSRGDASEKFATRRSAARVAGWTRRKSEARYAQDAVRAESTAQIIARNLRSNI